MQLLQCLFRCHGPCLLNFAVLMRCEVCSLLHHVNALLVLISEVGGKQQFPRLSRWVKKSFNSQDALAAESFARKETIKHKNIWLDLKEIIIFLAHVPIWGEEPRRCRGRLSNLEQFLLLAVHLVTGDPGQNILDWAQVYFSELSSFPESPSDSIFQFAHQH